MPQPWTDLYVACATPAAYVLPKLYRKVYYSISAAIHSKARHSPFSPVRKLHLTLLLALPNRWCACVVVRRAASASRRSASVPSRTARSRGPPLGASLLQHEVAFSSFKARPSRACELMRQMGA